MKMSVEEWKQYDALRDLLDVLEGVRREDIKTWSKVRRVRAARGLRTFLALPIEEYDMNGNQESLQGRLLKLTQRMRREVFAECSFAEEVEAALEEARKRIDTWEESHRLTVENANQAWMRIAAIAAALELPEGGDVVEYARHVKTLCTARGQAIGELNAKQDQSAINDHGDPNG